MQEISRTKIKSRLREKTNPELKETIALALKHPKWGMLAKKLSFSTNHQTAINLDELDKKIMDKDVIVLAGKLLSRGELTKKVKISALSFSEKAKEKLIKSKISFSSIKEQIISNPEAKGVVLI